MAFREDVDALHARIEGLERELEQARTKLGELDAIILERDRLKARLEVLEPKKKPQPRPQPKREPERDDAIRTHRETRSTRIYWFLGILALAAVAGAYYLFGFGAYDTRAPSIGVIDLTATPNPAPIPFLVTGTDAAPDACAGYLPSAPQLVLRVSAPTLVHVTTRCQVDLVAVMTGLPTGRLCDDDGGEGAQPLLETILPAGETRLTIGTYSENAQANCEIDVIATGLAADVDANGLSLSSPPTLGTVSFDAEPTTEAHFGGAISVQPISANRLDGACRGVISVVPDFAIEITQPTIVRIDAASSNDDLVLVMRDVDGTFTCDDDDGPGNSPRIAKRVPPGQYSVWVGSYASAALGTRFEVAVQLTTVASEANRSVASMDLAMGSSVHVTGQSGDELWAASMWSSCDVGGYVGLRPTRTFRLAARADVMITSGRQDLLLAVTAHGAHTTVAPCTRDPEWRAPLDAGAYDLYVGVASGDAARSDFDLVIAAVPSSVLPYTP